MIAGFVDALHQHLKSSAESTKGLCGQVSSVPVLVPISAKQLVPKFTPRRGSLRVREVRGHAQSKFLKFGNHAGLDRLFDKLQRFRESELCSNCSHKNASALFVIEQFEFANPDANFHHGGRENSFLAGDQPVRAFVDTILWR
jgi:hypothetical protein